MANTFQFFMAPQDEVAFLRLCAPYGFDVYPRRVPPGYVAPRASAERHSELPEEDLYLHLTEAGPALVDRIKRGPDKGAWRIDEVKSPVIYWERSRPNEDGELLSGKFWSELDITPQTGRRNAASDLLRRVYLELEGHLRKTYRHGRPKPWWIGPQLARQLKAEPRVLRINAHRGGVVEVI